MLRIQNNKLVKWIDLDNYSISQANKITEFYEGIGWEVDYVC